MWCLESLQELTQHDDQASLSLFSPLSLTDLHNVCPNEVPMSVASPLIAIDNRQALHSKVDTGQSHYDSELFYLSIFCIFFSLKYPMSVMLDIISEGGLSRLLMGVSVVSNFNFRSIYQSSPFFQSLILSLSLSLFLSCLFCVTLWFCCYLSMFLRCFSLEFLSVKSSRRTFHLSNLSLILFFRISLSLPPSPLSLSFSIHKLLIHAHPFG